MIQDTFWLAVEHLQGRLKKSSAMNVNASGLREEARQLAQYWFREARPECVAEGLGNEDLTAMDSVLQRLNQLALGGNAKSSYQRVLRDLRQQRPQLESLALTARAGTVGLGRGAVRTPSEVGILKTLGLMLPGSATCYEQVLRDLADIDRVSYRGTATELREVVREVLDHLAPDADVMGSGGFKLERDRIAPTMKQKARFILKARGVGESSRTAPEQAVAMLEEHIASLARSVYERGSASTHGPTSRIQVLTFKGFADAVLAELLQLHGAA